MSETRPQRQARLRAEYLTDRPAIVSRYTLSRTTGRRVQFTTRIDWTHDDHAADMRTVYRLAYVTKGGGKTDRGAAHWLECVRITGYDKARHMWTGPQTETRAEVDPTDAERLAEMLIQQAERMAGTPQPLYAQGTAYAPL